MGTFQKVCAHAFTPSPNDSSPVYSVAQLFAARGVLVEGNIKWEDPCVFEIDSLEAFKQMQPSPDPDENKLRHKGVFIFTKSIDATDTKFWNDGSGFIPLGLGDLPFSGLVIGMGQEITGLTIYRPLGNGEFLGFIGSLYQGGIVCSEKSATYFKTNMKFHTS